MEFGLSVLLFGAISVAWHDSDLWAHAQAIAGRFAAVPAWGCTALLCAGALALLLGRSVPGSLLVGVGGALLTLSTIVDIAAAPASYPSYIDTFELFAIVCGAAALYAQEANDERRARQLVRVALLAFACCNLSYAVAQVVFFTYTASLIPGWIPGATFWTALSTAAFALAAVAMAIGRQTLLALRLLATMVGLFAVLVWIPRLVVAPTLQNWSEFMLTWVIAGAAWTLAAAVTSVEAS
jgi:hypothetical protein